MPSHRADVILAGAGLASSLIALRLKALRPQLRVVVLERDAEPADKHTWSYFATDVSKAASQWLGPLNRRTWPEYLVRFPAFEREVATGYASIDEGRLQQALQAALGEDLVRGVDVERLTAGNVVLVGGEIWQAPLVIDGRGAQPSARLWLAWQKFRGIEVRLKRPHGLERPILMDSSVRQLDGYRFLYVLPFGPDTLLIEDTRYSDGEDLDASVVEADALRYARAQGWAVAAVVRRETGVLPVTLGGDIDAFWAEQPADVPSVGMRAALFHPTTGYSLPDAVRVADLVAAARRLESRAIRALIESHSRRLWARRSFYRALNRMMFLAAAPQERWRVLARFYGLSRPLIQRFYAGESTLKDRLRLVAGKPPVPLKAAMSAILQKAPLAPASA